MSTPDLSNSLEELARAVSAHRSADPKRKHFPDHIIEATVNLAAQGLSGEAIGRKVGLGSGLVYAWIKRAKETKSHKARLPSPRVVDILPPVTPVSRDVTRSPLNLRIGGYELTILASEVTS